MSVWKWVGLAGVVGVAAVGIAAGATTIQRRRRQYADIEPDELTLRLRNRWAEAQARLAG